MYKDFKATTLKKKKEHTPDPIEMLYYFTVLTAFLTQHCCLFYP